MLEGNFAVFFFNLKKMILITFGTALHFYSAIWDRLQFLKHQKGSSLFLCKIFLGASNSKIKKKYKKLAENKSLLIGEGTGWDIQ